MLYISVKGKNLLWRLSWDGGAIYESTQRGDIFTWEKDGIQDPHDKSECLGISITYCTCTYHIIHTTPASEDLRNTGMLFLTLADTGLEKGAESHKGDNH